MTERTQHKFTRSIVTRIQRLAACCIAVVGCSGNASLDEMLDATARDSAPGKIDAVGAESCASGEWSTTTAVENVSIHDGIALAVDQDEGLHVAFGDGSGGGLEYAYKKAGDGWKVVRIGGGGGAALAVDQEGGVHISYRGGYPAYELKYTYMRPGVAATKTETIDSQGSTASLAVDAGGGVHLVYYFDDGGNAGLKYVHKGAGDEWSIAIVESASDVSGGTSLAVDAGGGVHISYYDYDGDLKYTHKPAGGNWSTAAVDSVGNDGVGSSLAVDANGGVHISYPDQINLGVKYAYKSLDGDWTTVTVDLDGYEHIRILLAVDEIDRVHLLYSDGATAGLRYAYKLIGTDWDVATLGSLGYASGAALALDESGGIHISYAQISDDETGYNLKYSRVCP